MTFDPLFPAHWKSLQQMAFAQINHSDTEIFSYNRNTVMPHLQA
jgi:hypothetical protein